MRNDTAIFIAIKGNQRVFNGYGAQETCDMLCGALIHPCMPVYQLCVDDVLWDRFRAAVINYQQDRFSLLGDGRFTYVSSDRPFGMNNDAHRRFLAHVACYRREHVFADQACIDQLQKFDLLNPSAVIQPTGFATGNSIVLACLKIY